MKKILSLAILFSALSFGAASFAVVPDLIPVQGVLTNSSGNAVNGLLDMRFDIYDAETGGTMLWQSIYDSSTQQVRLRAGAFLVYLGELPAHPLVFADLVSANELWLQITANDEPMTRIRIAAVPFALECKQAKRSVVVANKAAFSEGIMLTDACQNFLAVTIEASGPGTVIVSANTWVSFYHQTSLDNAAAFIIGEDNADCADDDDGFPYVVWWSLPPEWPSAAGYIEKTVHVERVFTISAAGSYGYYLNAKFWADAPSTEVTLWNANMYAHFVPN